MALVTRCFASFLAITSPCLPALATPKVVDDGIVIEDVTLISPERQAPVPHVPVVIRNGRFVQIAPGLVAGPHATRIDGHDRL
jgi:hypothetical protein